MDPGRARDDAREPDPALAVYEGHRRSYSPWLSNFRVVQRNGELVWFMPDGWRSR